VDDLIYKLNKTDEDINALIQNNQGLIYHMLKIQGQLNNQEAESACWDALWNAVTRFDVFSSTLFSTFACTVIRNAINDVLRKQQRINQNSCMVTETNLVAYNEDTHAKELLIKIYRAFDKYLASKSGVTRNVLIAWQGTNFEANTTNIAMMCNTTASYVSRVLCSFRAYLAVELRKV